MRFISEKKVRRAAKKDRGKWLEALVASGDWGVARQLKKGCKVNQSRLTNARAATFAKRYSGASGRET